MTVDEIREIYYIEKAKYDKSVEIAENCLDILDDKTIADATGLTVDEVAELRKNKYIDKELSEK